MAAEFHWAEIVELLLSIVSPFDADVLEFGPTLSDTVLDGLGLSRR